MRAIGQYEYGPPEVLQFVEVPEPEPRPRDLVVRVKAVSVNPVDTKVRYNRGAGAGPVPRPPLILGWDGAGVVERLGGAASRFEVGDEVYFAGDVTRPGSDAERLAIDERIVGRKPRTLSFEQAAALPLTALTAWEGLMEHMGLRPDGQNGAKTLLIVAGAGGVGSIAIQIAKRLCQVYVIATASRPKSSEFCRQLGADAIVDHSQDFLPQIQALGLNGVDYVLNGANLTNLPQLVAVLNPLGHICSILGGAQARNLDLSGLTPKRGTLSFELMFTRPQLNVEPERQGAILDRVAELLDRGVLKSTMTRVLDWSQIQEAHRAIESGRTMTMGKIVLRVT